MDQYRVFGNPIAQSKSPQIHQWFAQQTGQALNYQSELVELTDFEQALAQFSQSGGKGLNITVPFKEQAYSVCHQLSEYARLAGAVNTISCLDGKYVGDNTDGIGLVTDLINQQVEFSGKSILLLGAGGAAKGVVLPLLEQAPQSLIIANRTLSKAQAIADSVENYNNVYVCGFEQLKQSYDIVINATSAGLSKSKLPVSDIIFSEKSVCYDMIYGTGLTPFLQQAQQAGAVRLIDGLGMLVEQAAESFRIWRGVKPETEAVKQKLKQLLSQ
ncbi:shikimate dehydrogenase [Endozoicomonas sp. G2_1]|uniref:shikimate dehydrogenase n=1 Tax=Endozoicomonas sp. G2_1 TaxID=2821091 RepID=UPI001ADD4DC7|nr:shikimate dehydrogenase [Endozoicomonas sp. G2_1]MBO9491241.1 shikimate dehydrogenase [Endozoicomonas sp. G2_1]